MRTAAVIAVVLLMPLPARGHQAPTILGGPLTTRPVQEWDLSVRLEGALTPSLIDWYNEAVREKPKPATPPRPKRTPSSWSGTIEQWRPLVSTYFSPADVAWAMQVIACESGGDPNAKNPRSSASGLFQHLATYWEGRSAKAGWAGASIWDPEANIAVAAWLVYEGGGKGHWNASRHCWG